MAKAWKERIEPNLQKYHDVTYSHLGFTPQTTLKILDLPNTALYHDSKAIM